jgi:hypothetical protein
MSNPENYITCVCVVFMVLPARVECVEVHRVAEHLLCSILVSISGTYTSCPLALLTPSSQRLLLLICVLSLPLTCVIELNHSCATQGTQSHLWTWKLPLNLDLLGSLPLDRLLPLTFLTMDIGKLVPI